MNKNSSYLFALLLAGCSATDGSSDSDSNNQAGSTQAPIAVDSTKNQLALASTAMTALNDCVAGKVTELVNTENGNVDDQSTADIADKAVSSCDNLMDAAVNEHIENLQDIVGMPANDAASVKIVADTKRALETRSLSDWRKFHTDMKIGFAKTYVRVVANRFKPQSSQEERGQIQSAP